MLTRVRTILFALLVMGPVGCGTAATPQGGSLYDRLGGKEVVASISNQLIDETAAHSRLKRSFDGVNIQHVKTMLIEQLCNITDGPCTYTGDTMLDVHAGLKITEAEMYGMIEILKEIMVRHDVGIRERNELLALLAPMKRDVVTE